jgi:hypothetical protein
VELVAPQPGQVIGGPGVLLLARAPTPPRPDFRPVFEFSTDGANFQAVEGELGPDYGPDTFAARLDATLFPSGPLLLRVREGEFVTEAITVRVNELPRAVCVATADESRVTVDCSESFDPDGEVVSFRVNFGEGEPVETTEPIFEHSYTTPGTFDLVVGVFDDLGFFVNWSHVVQVDLTEIIRLLQARECGCDTLFLFTGGMGALRDPRRPAGGGAFNSAPLGADPMFASTNFEIEALLLAGSDPDLCEEGQLVRGTGTIAGFPPQDKRACSAGRSLPTCTANADCDTNTCQGGTMNGQNCDGLATTPGGQVVTRAQLCGLAGGICQSNGDGVCTAYPFAGGARGNDDYREHSPGDEFTKFVCPGCGSPRWFDAPGFAAAPAADIRFDADFLAFMRGTRDCQCHFRVVVDWVADTDPDTPGNQPGHRPGGASAVTLIMDAETMNCTEAP